jgi:hypothetical protein
MSNIFSFSDGYENAPTTFVNQMPQQQQHNSSSSAGGQNQQQAVTYQVLNEERAPSNFQMPADIGGDSNHSIDSMIFAAAQFFENPTTNQSTPIQNSASTSAHAQQDDNSTDIDFDAYLTRMQMTMTSEAKRSPSMAATSASTDDGNPSASPPVDRSMKTTACTTGSTVIGQQNVVRTRRLPYVCYDCDEQFVLKTDYMRHKMGQLPQIKYTCKCQVCGKMFATAQLVVVCCFDNCKMRTIIQSHAVLAHHPTDVHRHQCAHCTRRYRSTAALHRHVVCAHVSNKPFR